MGFFESMDVEKICWLTAMIMGGLLCVSGVVYWISKKEKKDSHYAMAAFMEFVSCWILYIPEELFNDLTCPNKLLRIVEGVITALLKSVNVYSGNGYERVEYADYMIFSSIYGVIRVSANIILLLFIGGFIIKFFAGPFQKIKLFFCKRRYTYIFSEYSEKTIAIAKSIFSERNEKKINIVFACDKDKEVDSDFIASINGMYINCSVNALINKVKNKSKGMEIFLFENSEENNLIKIEKICKELETYSGNNIRIYIELLETSWSLYDGFSKQHHLGENIVLNFVRTEENFIYNTLLKHSIFEGAVQSSGYKEIKLLLIGGMNSRNIEMFKAVLHLSQMPGYRLNMTVMDDAGGRSKLKQLMPEIWDESDVEGDAIYKLNYYENIDYESEEYEQLLETVKDFNFVFINAGDDLLNIDLALRLNAMCHRYMRLYEDYTILVNVVHQEMCNKWNADLLENIQIIGDIDKVYDYRFITMSDIEKGAIAIHEIRQKGKENPECWAEYCNSEYNRHSVYARTLSFKYKVELIEKFYGSDYDVTQKDIIWKKHEHMRWNMYTRTLGYRRCESNLLDGRGEVSKKLRSQAYVHSDLVDFDQLSVEKQKRDELKLTPEIVQILKSI